MAQVVWTLSSLIAAAVDSKHEAKVVKIGRGEFKSELRCTAKRDDDGFYVTFTHLKDGGTLTPNDAEALLKRQKALTPKLTKAAKKARRKAKKEANKAPLIAVVPAPVAEGEKS